LPGAGGHQRGAGPSPAEPATRGGRDLACRGPEPGQPADRARQRARGGPEPANPTLTALAAAQTARLARAFSCPGGIMSQVLKLRNERAQLNTQLQALAKIEADGGALSAEQLAQFAELESQINELTAKISRAEAAERLAASGAVPVGESAQGIAGPPGSRVEGPYNKPTEPG